MSATTDTPMRRCIGSTRFGIGAHDAAASDLPVHPSQKDGLGRMCHAHRRAYTNALRKAVVARKATGPLVVVDAEPEPVPEPAAEPIDEAETPMPRRSGRFTAEPEVAVVEVAAE